MEEEPSGARTWVASSGTENSVFSWSVWRRLPLHEVRASFRVLLCALSIFHITDHLIDTDNQFISIGIGTSILCKRYK